MTSDNAPTLNNPSEEITDVVKGPCHRHTADTITDDALTELYDDLDRYEEVQGDMNEKAINLTREVARAQAALSDMTRDRNRQKWYVGENDRKRKVQRAHANHAEATLREVLDAFEAYWARASYCGPDMSAVQPEHFQAWRATLTQTAAATEATDTATVARVQRLLNTGPIGTCCAHLVRAALGPAKQAAPPPGPCPACRRADQAGLAPSEQHAECAPQEQPDMPS